jgi:preprotein translocase subunit SecB
MEIEKLWDYYKLIKFNIQLDEVELYSIEGKKNEKFEDEFGDKDEGENALPLKISISKRSDLINDEKIEVFVRITLDFDEKGPFYLKVIYRGVCSKNVPLDNETFIQQTEDQAVPLLLPYLRECISTTLTRMGYPPYILPAIDVLQTIGANVEEQPEE